jgi:hypothetical protein
MFPLENFSDFFSENSAKLLAYCPVCNGRYNFFQAKIIEEGEDSYLVYLNCKKCQAGIIALLLNNIYGISSIGLVTDLDHQDVQRLIRERELDYDDVIEMHQILQKKRGLLEYMRS